MGNVTVNFNGQDYVAEYNSQTGYYELNLTAPEIGGVYTTNITYTDIIGGTISENIDIRVLKKEDVKIETNKVFMWIFDFYSFKVKDIVEIADYEINIDEETNAKTQIKVLKKTLATSQDIVAIKKNNSVIYWGIIDEIQNVDGEIVYTFLIKYLTNLFDRKIQLQNQNIIRNTGVEDFITNTISSEYISNVDTFINLNWLEVTALTHTPKEISVTNVENDIYNLHTWLTNCTQKYDIVYNFFIKDKKLNMTIENKTFAKELIDTKAQAISQYTEVFETDVVSKVIVLYNKVNGIENPGAYTLYLLNNRTTTTDMTNPNRAAGKVETVYTENYEDANQLALDTMKSNSYNHNITFNMYKKLIKVGTPIAIKTKESIIYDSYISSIKITPKDFIEYICGNIRINFIDKLLKERRN